MWAITNPTSTTPVTAMTTFFPIIVCQKAITGWLTATLCVVTYPTGWTRFPLVLLAISASFFQRLLFQRGVSWRPLRLQHSVTQFVLTELWGDAILLCFDSDCYGNRSCDFPELCERRKQGRRWIFERRRICGKRSGRCQHHRLGDSAGT